MRSDLRKMAHLQEQLTNDEWDMLLNSNITGEVKKFLSKYTKKLLIKFVVADHFKVDTSETAEVKIAYVDSELSGVVEDISGDIEVPVYHSDTSREMFCSEIVKHIGGEEQAVTFAGIFGRMKRQGKGQEEKDGLLVDGHANFFLVFLGGALHLVCVDWRGRGWHVYVDSVGDSLRWSAGLRCFSQF